MNSELGPLTISRKDGRESFHSSTGNLDFNLLSFWQWANSDLIGNTGRGAVSEYLVARALGLAKDGIRNDWAGFDLETDSHLKIEVKSSAYVQSWFQQALSKIVFGVAKKRAWDPSRNVMSDQPERQADLYVFALLAHEDKKTVDPMNVDQWRFYVLPTSTLNERKRSQHSITLKSLEALCKPVRYADLRREVETVERGLRRCVSTVSS